MAGKHATSHYELTTLIQTTESLNVFTQNHSYFKLNAEPEKHIIE